MQYIVKTHPGLLNVDNNYAVLPTFPNNIEYWYLELWYYYGFADGGTTARQFQYGNGSEWLDLPFINYLMPFESIYFVISADFPLVIKQTGFYWNAFSYWNVIYVLRLTNDETSQIKFLVFSFTNDEDNFYDEDPSPAAGVITNPNYVYFPDLIHWVFPGKEFVAPPDSNIDYTFGATPRVYTEDAKWYIRFFSESLDTKSVSVTFTWTMVYHPFYGGSTQIWSDVFTNSGNFSNVGADMPLLDSSMVGSISLTITCNQPDWKSVLPKYHWAVGYHD